MITMTEQLISPTFLFRFAVPCHYRRRLWGVNGIKLPPRFRLPTFGQLENKPSFADLRMAWNGQGLAFQLEVTGKSQTPWCRDSRVEDSDGVQLWIDTRDTHNIHRASRYCHRFAFLPLGHGSGGSSPVTRPLAINRAKDQPRPSSIGALRVRSEQRARGYLLTGFIPRAALDGYDPEEYPRLGFTYAVIDRELGWQTFSVGSSFPFMEDPSLWGTLELVGR